MNLAESVEFYQFQMNRNIFGFSMLSRTRDDFLF